MKNLRDRAIRYFEAQGYRRVETKSSKYVKMDPSKERFSIYGNSSIFLGSSGAIRKGKTATDSISITAVYWKFIENWENTKLVEA